MRADFDLNEGGCTGLMCGRDACEEELELEPKGGARIGGGVDECNAECSDVGDDNGDPANGVTDPEAVEAGDAGTSASGYFCSWNDVRGKGKSCLCSSWWT